MTTTTLNAAAKEVQAATIKANAKRTHEQDPGWGGLSWAERGACVAIEATERLLGTEEQVRRPIEGLLPTFAEESKQAAKLAGTRNYRFRVAYVSHLKAAQRGLYQDLPGVRQARQLAQLRNDATLDVAEAIKVVDDMAERLAVAPATALEWADRQYQAVARRTVAERVLLILDRFESGDHSFTCWHHVLAALAEEAMLAAAHMSRSSSPSSNLLEQDVAMAWAHTGGTCLRMLREGEGWIAA